MFFTNSKGIISKQMEELKDKSLEITSLEKENMHLRFTQKKILNRIRDFDYISGNPFNLINSIKDDLKD